MGRKIPGRKHRGVKDPEKQAAVRFESIKNKINAPPSNPDDQQIPSTLQRVIDLKNKVKSGDFNKRRKGNPSKGIGEQDDSERVSKPRSKPGKPIPDFRQRPNESDRDFVRRVNKICMDVTREAKFEEKYGIEILKNEDGTVEAVIRRPKDELEVLLKKVRKERKQKTTVKKTKKKGPESPKLTKSQKWQQKKKEKKLKKGSRDADEFARFKDTVKFGETVQAPPTLVAPRIAQKADKTPRPGRKSLLLKSLMNPNKDLKQNQTTDVLRKTSNKAIDKKGKRKDLPNATRRQLDKQQKEVIDAYKQLKSQKYVYR